MEVQLRIILGEERFELLLRSRPLHTLFIYVFIFLLTAELEIFVLLYIAILQQGAVFLPKVWLAVGWLASTCSTGWDSSRWLAVQFSHFTILRFHTTFHCFPYHLIHGRPFLNIAIDEIRQESCKVIWKRHFFISICIHSSHDGIDIVIADKRRLWWWSSLAPSMGCHDTLQ